MLQAVFHWLGYGLCHQLPERSFFAGGYQLPVCARDTGIYFGVVISLGVMGVLDAGRHRTSLPRPWLLAVGAALLAFMAWDGVTSYAGWRTTTNDLRLLTGLCAGFALTLIVGPLLDSQLWRSRSDARVLALPWEPWVWLAAIPVSFVVLRWGAPLLGVVYPLATSAAILTTFTAVNLVVVSLAPRFEQRAGRAVDLMAPAAIALAISLAEIAALALLRTALLSLVVSR